MEDPTAIVPYYDPFDDNSCSQDFQMFDEIPNLGLSELPSFAGPSSFNPSIPQSGDEILDSNADPLIWNMCEPMRDDFQQGFSGNPGVTNNQEGNPQSQNSEFGNPIQLSIWPVPPNPYSCTCCQVLREITHTNGTHMTKLEIHGRIGIICHAILENHFGVDRITPNNGYQMFDFCKNSIESVKQFLTEYCEERKQAGYFLVQDPFLLFYEALSVGLDGDDYLDVDDFLHPSPFDAGECQMNQPGPVNQPEGENDEARHQRSSLAAQRERTGKLTLKDFVEYFHLPIDDAAKQMNICPTVVKKICRRDGLLRWPYRKIKSIERKISSKRASLNSNDLEERASAQADIERLQQELANIFAGFRDGQ